MAMTVAMYNALVRRCARLAFADTRARAAIVVEGRDPDEFADLAVGQRAELGQYASKQADVVGPMPGTDWSC